MPRMKKSKQGFAPTLRSSAGYRDASETHATPGGPWVAPAETAAGRRPTPVIVVSQERVSVRVFDFTGATLADSRVRGNCWRRYTEAMQELRQQILDALRGALEPLDYVNAMWLGGSSAMGGEDELSDIDVVLDVADGRQDDAFAVVEAALEREIAPIELQWNVPEPTWHGHSQRFYRLAGSPDYMMIDLVVMQRNSTAMRFDEREIHGEPQVIFDKLGIVKAVPLDIRCSIGKLSARRIEQLKLRFELLKHFPSQGTAARADP